VETNNTPIRDLRFTSQGNKPPYHRSRHTPACESISEALSWRPTVGSVVRLDWCGRQDSCALGFDMNLQDGTCEHAGKRRWLDGNLRWLYCTNWVHCRELQTMISKVPIRWGTRISHFFVLLLSLAHVGRCYLAACKAKVAVVLLHSPYCKWTPVRIKGRYVLIVYLKLNSGTISLKTESKSTKSSLPSK
jgi:hypothetical protein